jgi:hypothetical protein
MAEIACSLYPQKRNLAPQKSPNSVTVAGEAFSALSVRRRSPCFALRPILSRIFDGTKTLVHAQINYLRMMISSLPSKSTFDEIHLWGETGPETLWDLLEVIDRDFEQWTSIVGASTTYLRELGYVAKAYSLLHLKTSVPITPFCPHWHGPLF